MRWRASGELVCAAMHEEMEGDSYISDRVHYQLSVVSRAVIADANHEENGIWYWVHNEDAGKGFLRAQLEKEVLRESDSLSGTVEIETSAASETENPRSEPGKRIDMQHDPQCEMSVSNGQGCRCNLRRHQNELLGPRPQIEFQKRESGRKGPYDCPWHDEMIYGAACICFCPECGKEMYWAEAIKKYCCYNGLRSHQYTISELNSKTGMSEEEKEVHKFIVECAGGDPVRAAAKCMDYQAKIENRGHEVIHPSRIETEHTDTGTGERNRQ